MAITLIITKENIKSESPMGHLAAFNNTVENNFVFLLIFCFLIRCLVLFLLLVLLRNLSYFFK